jgi:hypothetical protein
MDTDTCSLENSSTVIGLNLESLKALKKIIEQFEIMVLTW